MAKQRITEADYPEIQKRYENGESLSFIGRAFNGKDRSTILFHLKKMGIWKKGEHVVITTAQHKKDPIHLCIEENCSKESLGGRGYCHNHYMKHWEKGEFSSDSGDPYSTFCDHSTNRCQCINTGKSGYNAYLREAGYRHDKKKRSSDV